MDKILQTVDSTMQPTLESIISKPTIIRGVVHLFLILYAARLAPVPPRQVLVLIDNVYFKLACFSLILWTSQFSPSTSILIALAFMVTINYSTTGKVWEMMENIAQTQPVAPSKEIAMAAVTQTMTTQQTNAPVVGSVTQNPNTIVITPSVINTPSGPAVINPTVVVAPATVASPSGEKITVTPQVTTMSTVPPPPTASMPVPTGSNPSGAAPAPAPAPTTPTPAQSIEAVKVLVKAAESPAASDPKAVANIANVAVANVTSQAAVASIEKLAKQAVVAEAGVPEKVKVEATKVIDSIKETPVVAKPAVPVQQTQDSGCFPMRSYDMTKVTPQTSGVVSFEDYQTWTPSK